MLRSYLRANYGEADYTTARILRFFFNMDKSMRTFEKYYLQKGSMERLMAFPDASCTTYLFQMCE